MSKQDKFSEKNKELDFPIIFYESKVLFYFLAIIFTISFFASAYIMSDVFRGINNLTTFLFGFLVFFIFLAVLLIFFPSSWIIINKDGFIYKKGRIKWKASWDEVEALYGSPEQNLFIGSLQIKNKLGSTKIISVPLIMKKGSSMPSLSFLFSLNYLEFVRKFNNYKNKDSEELISILEKLSNKKTEPYIFTGLEKIRK